MVAGLTTHSPDPTAQDMTETALKSADRPTAQPDVSNSVSNNAVVNNVAGDYQGLRERTI
jgi:hypothetical protein